MSRPIAAALQHRFGAGTARLLTVSILVWMLVLPARATSPAFLVRDINQKPGLSHNSTPNQFVTIGTTTYFAASDAQNGTELWKTDGTAAGTVLIRDLNPGSGSSYPHSLTSFKGQLFFGAFDGSATMLWRSDGTFSGTQPLKRIAVSNMVDVNGTLFFAGYDAESGTELWKSDGTPDGTTLVLDIVPGSGGSYPAKLTNVNGIVFFSAHDPASGRELWKSDGSANGTALLKDIHTGPSDALNIDEPMAGVKGALIFAASDDFGSSKLWKSDGTPNGTVLLKDLAPYWMFASQWSFTMVNDTLFFRAYDANGLFGLWRSDGTPAGTTLVKEISLVYLVNVGGTLYFSAGPESAELWRSDGTPAGTQLVKSVFPVYHLYNLTPMNGMLFFTANDPVSGRELWKSDGTAAGTILVKDIAPGVQDSLPYSLAAANGMLLFAADDGRAGNELWRSDGTAAGTVLVKDIAPSDPGSSLPEALIGVGDTLFFHATDPVSGRELWKSDGTGATLVKDIRPGPDGSLWTSPELMPVGETLFFAADDGSHGFELWKSDGSATGTVLVKDIWPGADGSSPSELTNVGGTLFFYAYEQGSDWVLWRSDGTAAGTVSLPAPRPYQLTDVGGTLFFVANDGVELWKSDGTPAGTTLIKGFDRHPPVPCGRFFCFIPSLNRLFAVDQTLYFVAYDDSSGFELWRSDGTEAGTTLVKDISPGLPDASPQRLTNLDGTLFFDADDGVNGRELWRSEGTATGTTLVKDIFPGSGSAFNGPGSVFDYSGDSVKDMLAGANGELFFAAIDPVHGRELWRSDGTAAGTTLVKDIMPGAVGAAPHDLIQVGGRVVFAAADDVAGMEVWQTDGSAAGTTLAADIAPGAANANPASFALAGAHLFFSADDGAVGRELWAISSAGDVFVQAPALIGAAPGGVAAIPLWYGNNGLASTSALTLTATLNEGMVYVGDTSGVSPAVSGTTITWRLPEAGFLGGGAWTLYARVPDAAFGTRYPVALSVTMDAAEARLSNNAVQIQVMVARQMYLATLRR